jgi:hypothetical protein
VRTALKSVATSAAVLGAMGAAAVGVTSIASFGASGPAQVQLAAAGVPLPQDPPPPAPSSGLPTPDLLSHLCTQVTDPGVGYTTMNNLVQGGISPNEADVAEYDLRKAYLNGNFPEQFAVSNIQPAGPNAATADVAISGPKFAGPVTKNLAFVNTGENWRENWKLQHDSALALLQAATATN